MRTWKIAAGLALVLGAGAAVAWYLAIPTRLSDEMLAAVPPGDPARGEQVFHAGGCASCHATPGAETANLPELPGGLELKTPFGLFVAPNISSHQQDGIGGWSFGDFANAMMRGVSPGGMPYYPAFPYTSYARMELGDVADLFAYMRTLPAVEGEAAQNQLGFPYSIRRGVGLWQRLFLGDEPVVALASADERVRRGQYLVEGPGHCGECHTPRNAIGGPDYDNWLGGAAAAAGSGRVPNITPAGDIGSWSEEEIADYLSSGFTPEFDVVGGEMADVVKNLAQLPDDDRLAIAAYLKAIPAVAD